VIEDTHWTLEMLEQEGFPSPVIKAIECVTRRADETYDAFIDRLISNPIARKIKLADIEDNMDIRRLETLTDKDIERLIKYQRIRLKLLRFNDDVTSD
jgi:hypothetical protein